MSSGRGGVNLNQSVLLRVGICKSISQIESQEKIKKGQKKMWRFSQGRMVGCMQGDSHKRRHVLCKSWQKLVMTWQTYDPYPAVNWPPSVNRRVFLSSFKSFLHKVSFKSCLQKCPSKVVFTFVLLSFPWKNAAHVWWWGGRRGGGGHLLPGEKWPCSAQTLPFLPRYLPVLPRSPFLCAPTPTAQPQIGISALQYSSCIVLCVGLKIDFGILIVNVWTNWPFGWFW